MPSSSDAGRWLYIALSLQIAAAGVCLLGILGLRFLRRGAARFGVTPAMAALALAPVVLGAAVTAWAFHKVVSAMSLTGSRGAASVPVKLASLAALTAVGFGSAAALCGVYVQMSALGATAITGRPYEGPLGRAVSDAAVRMGADEEPGTLIVSVSAREGYALASRPVARQALKERLAAQRGSGRALALRAAPDASYALLIPVVDAAAEAGWEDIDLIAPADLRFARRLPVRLPFAPTQEQGSPQPIVARLGADGITLNKYPMESLDHLDRLLREVLVTRYSKAVFLLPDAGVPYHAVAAAVQVLLSAGAEPAVLLTPVVADKIPLPPPPPPPKQ